MISQLFAGTFNPLYCNPFRDPAEVLLARTAENPTSERETQRGFVMLDKGLALLCRPKKK